MHDLEKGLDREKVLDPDKVLPGSDAIIYPYTI
jgi:hypothetical protein